MGRRCRFCRISSVKILLHRGEGFLVSLYLLTMFWIGFCLGNFPVAKGEGGYLPFLFRKKLCLPLYTRIYGCTVILFYPHMSQADPVLVRSVSGFCPFAGATLVFSFRSLAPHWLSVERLLAPHWFPEHSSSSSTVTAAYTREHQQHTVQHTAAPKQQQCIAQQQ